MKCRAIAVSMLMLSLGWCQPLLAQARIDRPPFFEEGQEFLDREIQRLEQQHASPDESKPSPLTIEGDREQETENRRERGREEREEGDKKTRGT